MAVYMLKKLIVAEMESKVYGNLWMKEIGCSGENMP